MNKQGAINLTINSIVIIIFALAMLGLGLAFIKGSFTKVTEKVTFPAPKMEATAAEPIVLPFDTLTVRKGMQAEFTLNFYNNENASINLTQKPVITKCAPSGLGRTAISTIAVGQTVKVGDTASYNLLFTIPPTAPSQKYACNIQIASSSKQFFVQVR